MQRPVVREARSCGQEELIGGRRLTPATGVLLYVVVLPFFMAAQGPRAVFATNRIHFGKVIRGTVLRHNIVLRNDGVDTLRIGRIVATPPLVVTTRPDHVEGGTTASISVTLDTSRLSGPFEAEIAVALNDPVAPEERLRFRGEVYPELELSPAQPLILHSRSGEPSHCSAEIISHEAEPLRIFGVEHNQERLTVGIEALEDGRRYRLTVLQNPRAPVGHESETIRIATSSKKMPVILLLVDMAPGDRVWVSPNALSFGDLPISLLRGSPDVVRMLTREFTIHHVGSPGLQIQLRSDVPFLDVQCELRAPDRYTATVRLLADLVQAGPINGTVIVETNHPQFPRLVIPISGAILDQ